MLGIPAAGERGPLDRWILSRLASTTSAVTEALETYEPLAAATALAGLVDDLSNWYVRRSRRRFWRTDPDAPAGDTLAAQATLHTVLTTLSLLLAPLCPFVADAMWRDLTGADDGASVHLADWPVADVARVDPELEAQMELARRLTSLGRAARSEASVKVRQPLRRALVFLPADSPAILRDMVADELNVDEIDTADELSEVIQFELKPNFKTLGARLKDLVREVQPALDALDTAAAAAALEEGRSITVVLGGEEVELSPDDVVLRVRGQQGFAVSREGGEVVALDLEPGRGVAQARAVARRRPAGAGPAQGQRARGLRPHPPQRGGARRHRRVLRLHRPRGAGGLDRVRAGGGRGHRAWTWTTSCSPSRCGSGWSASTPRADSWVILQSGGLALICALHMGGAIRHPGLSRGR